MSVDYDLGWGQIRLPQWGHFQTPNTGGPTLVWIHGGALIFGHRGGIHPTQRDQYLAAGYVLVAIDYRLAPEVKLPAILEDVQDAFRWVRTQGTARFAIDPQRVAVVGHSAGGYLALLSGYGVQPRPRAIVSFYGYGDIISRPWRVRPAWGFSTSTMARAGVPRGV